MATGESGDPSLMPRTHIKIKIKFEKPGHDIPIMSILGR